MQGSIGEELVEEAADSSEAKRTGKTTQFIGKRRGPTILQCCSDTTVKNLADVYPDLPHTMCLPHTLQQFQCCRGRSDHQLIRKRGSIGLRSRPGVNPLQFNSSTISRTLLYTMDHCLHYIHWLITIPSKVGIRSLLRSLHCRNGQHISGLMSKAK